MNALSLREEDIFQFQRQEGKNAVYMLQNYSPPETLFAKSVLKVLDQRSLLTVQWNEIEEESFLPFLESLNEVWKHSESVEIFVEKLFQNLGDKKILDEELPEGLKTALLPQLYRIIESIAESVEAILHP